MYFVEYLSNTFFLSQACVNVRNDDQQCLKWSLLSFLHPAEKNADRVSKYTAFQEELNFSGVCVFVRKP